MTIEQKFFKSFNIPTKFYTTVNLGDLDNNYQEASANTLQELFDDNAFWIDTYIEDIKDFHDWEEKYPSITPEIVLGLIKVMGCFDIGQCDGLNAYILSKRQKYVESTTFENALLMLCIRFKDEIQDQVKALFK